MSRADILKQIADHHFGLAELYNELAESSAVSAAAPEAGPVPGPAPVDDLPEFPPMEGLEEAPKSRDEVYAECPDHQRRWVARPGGISRNGKPYKAFWSCPSPKDAAGNYCKKKPDPSWARAHDPEQALINAA